ncbi:hypothetical protein P280DRAFT_524514 [Massarina eburnea CBS 473.64]|uniref:Tyrosine specific protein phosphatases domain-containing protein n=1 Tax=Massarina eburnea CBS 473.64 TaxID=1395130 RepID=A0A6A6RFC0_9PLEO|nr:hypothetical protein P280DRAFT_524514 [Massarina eburnea CBS 473.64]
MISTDTPPPLPSPPFFTIPGVNNLRDAALHDGGITTSTGQHIRPGILFRSAEVSKVDREGWVKMKEMGVAHVFDLRSRPEVEKGWKGITNEGESSQDVKAEWEEHLKSVGVERTWVPVFTDKDYSPERLAARYMKYMSESEEGFIQAYHDILTNAGPAFKPIYQYLSHLPAAPTPTSPPSGALIHCTAGKDRTGIFIALLLSYLGVPHPTIAAEYQLTELGLGHIRDEIVSRLLQSPGFRKWTLSQVDGGQLAGKDFVDVVYVEGGVGAEELRQVPEEALEKGRRAALRMMSAKPESILGVLELVEREWGGVEGYFRAVVGLGDGELEGLRTALVVG